MSKPLPSEVAAAKIQEARILESLKEHAGWRIIARNIEALIEGYKAAILDPALSHEDTQRKRYQLEVLQWVLDSPGHNNEKQIDKWKSEMTYHQKLEKMRADAGLPQSREEMMTL